jgi:hypothetical protein
MTWFRINRSYDLTLVKLQFEVISGARFDNHARAEGDKKTTLFAPFG